MRQFFAISLVWLLAASPALAVYPNSGGAVVAVPGLEGTVGNDATYTATTELKEFGGIDASQFSHIYMAGAIRGTVALTSSTDANPVVVTKNAHGFADNDVIYIEGVTTQVELNDAYYLVDLVGANSFNLQSLSGIDIDGTGHAGAGTGGTAVLGRYKDFDTALGWGTASNDNDGSSIATPLLGFVNIHTAAGPIDVQHKPKLWIHVKPHHVITDDNTNDYFKQALDDIITACTDPDEVCLVLSSDYAELPSDRALLDCGDYTDIGDAVAVVEAIPSGSVRKGWVVSQNVDFTCQTAAKADNNDLAETNDYGQIAFLNSAMTGGNAGAEASPYNSAAILGDFSQFICINCSMDNSRGPALSVAGEGTKITMIGSGQTIKTTVTQHANDDNIGTSMFDLDEGMEGTFIGHKFEMTGFQAGWTEPDQGAAAWIFDPANAATVRFWFARNLFHGADASVEAAGVKVGADNSPAQVIYLSMWQNTFAAGRMGMLIGNFPQSNEMYINMKGNLFYAQDSADGAADTFAIQFLYPWTNGTFDFQFNLVDGGTPAANDSLRCRFCESGGNLPFTIAELEAGSFDLESELCGATACTPAGGTVTVIADNNGDLHVLDSGNSPFIQAAGPVDGPGYICAEGKPCEGFYTAQYQVPLAVPLPTFIHAGQQSKVTHLNLNTSGVGNAGWK